MRNLNFLCVSEVRSPRECSLDNRLGNGSVEHVGSSFTATPLGTDISGQACCNGRTSRECRPASFIGRAK